MHFLRFQLLVTAIAIWNPTGLTSFVAAQQDVTPQNELHRRREGERTIRCFAIPSADRVIGIVKQGYGSGNYLEDLQTRNAKHLADGEGYVISDDGRFAWNNEQLIRGEQVRALAVPRVEWWPNRSDNTLFYLHVRKGATEKFEPERVMVVGVHDVISNMRLASFDIPPEYKSCHIHSISRGGDIVAVGGDDSLDPDNAFVAFFSIKSSMFIRRVSVHDALGNEKRVMLSTDGTVAATWHKDQFLGVLEIASGNWIAEFAVADDLGNEKSDGRTSFCFSPDNRWLAVFGTDACVVIYDTTTWKATFRMIPNQFPLGEYSWQDDSGSDIRWSPDSKRIAAQMTLDHNGKFPVIVQWKIPGE